MKIIFQIQGGIGKCIAATAVCSAIKAQYPDDELIVISGHPDVFQCNEHISENLRFSELQYFWYRNIKGQEPKVMLHNPYFEQDFIRGKGHLIEIWCQMFGIAYNGELPDLFLNSREINYYGNHFGIPQKPLLVIQTSGGNFSGNQYTNLTLIVSFTCLSRSAASLENA